MNDKGFLKMFEQNTAVHCYVLKPFGAVTGCLSSLNKLVHYYVRTISFDS